MSQPFGKGSIGTLKLRVSLKLGSVDDFSLAQVAENPHY